MYYWDDDDVVKQKISAELEKYTMSQKEVAEYLGMYPPDINRLIKEKRLVPMFVYNKSSSRNINVFFKPDVEKYKAILDVIRSNRKK
ncbi:TPA: DNA-binding protein [Listeria monocytogenes]|uniref:DNA-binding protein n=1 Tax=Listeria seeligeri TaxID=1640 RepID=UPI0010BBB628|nr:DNA-binding protein [Listeria seeligeri]EAC5586505.1 DNA-binding protein [Listeria monocytogenes]EAC9569973.1 DNA-binding protein [Listeria monocytogenes]EEO3273127.1 DNA-binding protein [Listeria monocytogenes]MBC1831875.1 DNA-binding protein [Listeria seeligeri]MBF2376052.1 DNA-binding protein [Listeria seeligeri]